MISLLDNGYIELIETWGSDERIIEAARMSTNKGFQGWGRDGCQKCDSSWDVPTAICPGCGTPTTKVIVGDEKLLAYLYNNKHSTPFEMAGMVIEVKAPIFIFREWHRHRTQSYNEMSARYTPLPDENYLPSIERIVEGATAALNASNRQAAPAANARGEPVEEQDFLEWLAKLNDVYRHAQRVYEDGLVLGVPKELARLPVPVARYSKMRASANLRNWLLFLTLRMDSHAQWEIRQYANVVASIIEARFPRTYALFAAK